MIDKYKVVDFPPEAIYNNSSMLEAFLNNPELLDYKLINILYDNGKPIKAIYILK